MLLKGVCKMVTDKERITEWLSRVASELDEINKSSKLSAEKIQMVRENYDILLVLTKVAAGTAFMVGIPPINYETHK